MSAEAASTLKKSLAAFPDVPEEIVDYAADTAAGLLDDMGDDDAAAIVTEMQDALGPLLEGLDEDAVKNLCEKAVAAFKGLDLDGDVSEQLAAEEANKKDFVVCCDGIILAYAGKSLLRSTSLRFERGHRYGIVGQNGVGKTTLLNRIAARDIAGFPQDIRCVYVQHEVLANDEQTVIDYMLQAQETYGLARSEDAVFPILKQMGFSEGLQKSAVLELSGGWKMKLALAGAILSKADLLMLDEPTNHLDVDAVAWLVNYLQQLSEATVVIVSHDYKFLDQVATDVVHFSEMQLNYYTGGWNEFKNARPDVIEALPKKKTNSYFAEVTGSSEALIRFPDPGSLDGVKSDKKPIMKFTGLTFRYPGGERDILKEVNVKLTMRSRVALLGANGAGKTTLLKLFVGELEQDRDKKIGEVWKHQNLRLAYIAQHSMHHLEENQLRTPITYIQDRFFQGRDRELAKMVTIAMTEEDKTAMAKRGNIREIVGRATRGGQLCYSVRKVGRRDEDESWENIDNLKCKDPYVMKLVRNFDEKMKTSASGMDVRPIDEGEVKRHLQEYNIDEELAKSKIKGFSGGQKSRLVLAAAMWNRPHILALDEPTNYLDNETVAALVRAIKSFKGAVLTISHNHAFVDKVSNEKWELVDGRVTVHTWKDLKNAEVEAVNDDDDD